MFVPTVASHLLSPTATVRISTFIFFFTDTATAEISTLSLHDALPICANPLSMQCANLLSRDFPRSRIQLLKLMLKRDRKSTRLNSSHRCISYAVFCLKKKNTLFYNHDVAYRRLSVIVYFCR